MKPLVIFAMLFSCVLAVSAQVKPKTPAQAVSPVRATGAFSEVLLRKAELSADLESMLVEYTEEYPPAQLIRAELDFLQKEIDRLLAVAPADIPKLSVALGKLMVRKAQAATEWWKLQRDYKEDHPDVKSAKRKIEVFEAAIKEILG